VYGFVLHGDYDTPSGFSLSAGNKMSELFVDLGAHIIHTLQDLSRCRRIPEENFCIEKTLFSPDLRFLVAAKGKRVRKDRL
jgi:hypothetical protein